MNNPEILLRASQGVQAMGVRCPLTHQVQSLTLPWLQT